MSLFAPPKDLATGIFTEMPAEFRRRNVESAWGQVNKFGQSVHSFLEGPSFDRQGNLYVVDIPFGRVFRIDPAGRWTQVAEYDGWPNGLKIHRDGRIFITDYRRGIVELNPETGAVTEILGHVKTEGLKGVNDLVFASNGDMYFTDQGQTGLHDPTGRVYRYNLDSDKLDLLINTVPSPNGLVLNPEETILYVAVTRANAVWRLPIMRDGAVSKVGLFVQLQGSLGGPDGLAMDVDGNLTVCQAGMGSAWQFSRLGEPRWRIRSCTGGLTTTNLAYGGTDNRQLFITESDTGTILRADLDVAGQPMYSHM
ncbi:MAG: SMP-30/gluconolactonase/LRE family protein [Rhodospirillales bacterium]